MRRRLLHDLSFKMSPLASNSVPVSNDGLTIFLKSSSGDFTKDYRDSKHEAD